MNCNCEDKMPSIFKNDDTGAFGNQLLKINRPKGLADDIAISKVEIKIATLPIMTFLPSEGEDTVEFPIYINLTAQQTALLGVTNYCYMKCYDANNLGQTCEGTAVFKAKAREV